MPATRTASPVVVSLKRRPGYDDVHPELVLEDALADDWSGWEVLRDEGECLIVSLGRPEGYERSSARLVASTAFKPLWEWSVVRRALSS